MRIGVVHWGFPPRTGGVETHLMAICPEMVRQGAEVYIFTEPMEGEPAEKDVKGVKVIRTEMISHSKLDRMAEAKEDIYTPAKKLFDEFLDKYKIEVMQAHNIHMDWFDFAKALSDACQERNIPCYPVLHNQEFIDRDMEETVKILEKLPWAKIVPISEFISKKIQASTNGIPKDKWKVILHGIELDAFSPLSPKEKEALKKEYGFAGRRVILHPARSMEWKGIVPAVKSVPAIAAKFPDMVLVLTGRIKPIYKEPEVIARYNRLVDKTIVDLKIGKNIYIGKYAYTDIPPLTSLADIAIYTTIGDEPFGLCPVEAMACKVPQVVTASGGLVESVIDGKTGFIIEKDEAKIPKQLAEKAIKILSDPKLAQKMGEAGRQRAEKVFDKKRMAIDFIKLSGELKK